VDKVNKLPPRFVEPWTPTSPYYVLTIPERQPTRNYVTTMVARDPDNDIVTYMLANDTGEFSLVPQTGRFWFDYLELKSSHKSAYLSEVTFYKIVI